MKNKYERTIRGLTTGTPITVDVYSVLTAFEVTSPGLQHAIKKLLCAGLRGKATRVQDLEESIQAIRRAIEDENHEAKQNTSRQMPEFVDKEVY